MTLDSYTRTDDKQNEINLVRAHMQTPRSQGGKFTTTNADGML